MDALLTMLTPFGCAVRADRRTAGMRAVHICGPQPVIEHVRERLGGLLADLDQAAQAAARRYGAWLRTLDPDEVPDRRRALTRQYRRAYLAAWAAAWAHRLSGLVRGDTPHPRLLCNRCSGTTAQPPWRPSTSPSSTRRRYGKPLR